MMATCAGPSDDPFTGNRKFHGVYLLYCLNPAYKGRTYIGYTVNPKRRIKQHNGGKHAGGAFKTSGRGPWEMVLIIHGFPTDVAGLRFEWAWQHPTSSRRLKHVLRKGKSEKDFDAKLRILSEMLRTGPWNRLPLTVQWLKQEYLREFPVSSMPPVHMPIAYGPITVKEDKKVTKSKDRTDDTQAICDLCRREKIIGENIFVKCCISHCSFKSHVLCLAEKISGERDHLVPVSVKCPKCGLEMLWGNLIYGKKKMMDENITNEDIDDKILSGNESEEY